jgi:hypothetical protein
VALELLLHVRHARPEVQGEQHQRGLQLAEPCAEPEADPGTSRVGRRPRSGRHRGADAAGRPELEGDLRRHARAPRDGRAAVGQRRERSRRRASSGFPTRARTRRRRARWRRSPTAGRST